VIKFSSWNSLTNAFKVNQGRRVIGLIVKIGRNLEKSINKIRPKSNCDNIIKKFFGSYKTWRDFV
jgi:hypothetical protein